MRRGIFRKLILTHIPDTKRAINFVHVDGRSLYIDWRMVVVVGEECPTPCKKGGRIVRAHVRLSVRLPLCQSVTRGYSVKTVRPTCILKLIPPSRSQNILVIRTGTKRYVNIPTRTPLKSKEHEKNRFISKTIQDTAIVTGKWETAPKLSSGVISNYLEWPIT